VGSISYKALEGMHSSFRHSHDLPELTENSACGVSDYDGILFIAGV
jgi:hypothetical protein